MNGILAQLVSLTSYGNAFLQGNDDIENFYPGNSTFQFCNKVNFVNFKKTLFSSTPKEVQVADNPIEWFRLLKKQGCKGLRLFYEPTQNPPAGTPDHKLAGMVGGGGTWMIETMYGKFSHYWFNRWQVTQKDDPERKLRPIGLSENIAQSGETSEVRPSDDGPPARPVWSVSYGMIDKDQPVSNKQFDIKEISSLLQQNLQNITAFAQTQQLSNWARVFTKAASILNSVTPIQDYYHQDLLVEKHYSLQARQLLAAAGAAWVFGGMGSWNDLGFDTDETNKTYDDLSAQLYNVINKAVLAVANSF